MAHSLEEMQSKLIGKTLFTIGGTEEIIHDVSFMKLKNLYEISTNNGEEEYSFNEVDIENMINGEVVHDFYVKEFKKEEEEPKTEDTEGLNLGEENKKDFSVIKFREKDGKDYIGIGYTENTEQENILHSSLSEEEANNLVEHYVKETGLRPYSEYTEVLLEEIEKKINRPEYTYYVIGQENKIVFGSEYKEDSRDFKKKAEEFNHQVRVVSKRDLPVDPNDNSNWSRLINTSDVIKRAIDWSISMSGMKSRELPGIGLNEAQMEWQTSLESGQNIQCALLGYINYIVKCIEKSRVYKLPFERLLLREYTLATEAYDSIAK